MALMEYKCISSSQRFNVYRFKKKEMKHYEKIAAMVEQQLSLGIRRERNFQIKTTVVLFSLSLVVFALGVFVSNNARKFLDSNDENYSYFRALVEPEEELPWHSMSDEELFRLASMVAGVGGFRYQRSRKVAFMFLTRGRLPLAPLWEGFFKGHSGLYSIYTHSPPEFTKEPPTTSVFYKRKISSKPVEWGRSTMIDAERRLLANALLDVSNDRFILLSETCIPLFNFATIYRYLTGSNHSFVGSFDDPRPMGRGRYNARMLPAVSLSDWRKGSQWFEVHRRVAVQIVSDSTFYPVFRDHCEPPCYVDEHYLATLVSKLSLDSNTNRSITWVDWSRGGPHPTQFSKSDVSEGLLGRVRNGLSCTYNGRSTTVCFLFARKFHPNTLEPLMKLAPKVLGFGFEYTRN